MSRSQTPPGHLQARSHSTAREVTQANHLLMILPLSRIKPEPHSLAHEAVHSTF